MTNQELSRKILELVGGKSNVVSAEIGRAHV